MSKKYQLPAFLDGIVSQEKYLRWLSRKAVAHRRSDAKRKKAGSLSTLESYKMAIHAAVIKSGGHCFYTGEFMEWDKISTYDNALSAATGILYKRAFARLPSVDHLNPETNDAFVICSWQANDSKNDMNHEDFISFCKKIIAKHEQN